MARLIFKYLEEDRIFTGLKNSLVKLAEAYNKNIIVSSGFRSAEAQITIAENLLWSNKNYYQTKSGAVYDRKTGKCMAAAYGNSNHCWGLAADVDGWAKKLNNSQLAEFDLRKPMFYEPWHIESTDTKNLSLEQKKQLFYAYMREAYTMDTKTFQMITGLTPDGIVGQKTIAKAKEVRETIKNIIPQNVILIKTGEDAVKWLYDSKFITSQDYWLKKIKEVQYLDTLLVKVVNEFRG